MAFVYLLSDWGQDNVYKIGVTRGKIEKRIKQLQTGNGNEICLVNYYETNYPFYLERMLHLKFGANNIKNEWFELKNDDALNFKEFCIEIERNIESLKNNPFAKKLLK